MVLWKIFGLQTIAGVFSDILAVGDLLVDFIGMATLRRPKYAALQGNYPQARLQLLARPHIDHKLGHYI